MVNDDGIEARIRYYANTCGRCRVLYALGIKHVVNMAMVRDGWIHLYANSGTPLCEDSSNR